MNATLHKMRYGVLMIAVSLILIDTAVAGDDIDAPPTDKLRGEIWLAVSSWPALGDLRPVAGGSFNDTGYGLGASVHWPVKSIQSADVLLGIEGAIVATGSDIPVFLDELLARDGYLAASAKWRLGKTHSLALDAGLAYHLLDITQLDTDYYSSAEFQSWEESAVGPFLGMTWNLGAGKPDGDSGMTLGARAHFLDFGTVSDEDVLASAVLGRDAGELDGPMYELRIGYRW